MSKCVKHQSVHWMEAQSHSTVACEPVIYVGTERGEHLIQRSIQYYGVSCFILSTLRAEFVTELNNIHDATLRVPSAVQQGRIFRCSWGRLNVDQVVWLRETSSGDPSTKH